MSNTEILSLIEVASADADKFVIHNKALRQIEGQTIHVKSRTNSGPPVSPSNGDTYIVDNATGNWSGGTWAVNDIAHYYGGAWYNYTPFEGLRVWIDDEDNEHIFDGTDWDIYNFNSGSGTYTFNLTDNTADALDIQEGSNNYININTTNASENISFGNATTNPSFSFLGSGTVTIAGDLVVNGTNTSVNVTNLDVDDPLIVLGDGNATDALDLGLILERSSNNIGIMWDESADEVVFIETTDAGATAGNVTIADYAPIHAGAGTFDDLSTFSSGLDSSSRILFNNNVGVNWKDSGGTERTGIVLDSSNNLDFYSGAGTLGMTLDSSQNVNIPSGNLGVGVTATSSIHTKKTGTGDACIVTIENDSQAVIQYGMFGSARAGTTFGQANADLAFMYSTTLSATHPSALAIGTFSTKPLILGTNNTEALRIDSSQNATVAGNLTLTSGIQTINATVGNPLVVNTTTTNTSINLAILRWRQATGSVADDDNSAIDWYHNSDTTQDAIRTTIRMLSKDVTHASRSSALEFYTTASGGSLTKGLEITETQNVEVPNGNLTVNGGFSTPASGDGQIAASSTNGLILSGRGSTNDMLAVNFNGQTLFYTPTTTQNVIFSTGGKIATGDETAPDVDAGGICINHGANDGNVLTFKNSDVAHGMTVAAETDTYASFNKVSATEGGLDIRGYSEGAQAARWIAYATTPNTGDTSAGVIDFYASKKSGTSVTSLTSGENLASFSNDGAVKVAIKDDGDIVTQGGLRISGGTDLLDTYEEGTWTPVLEGTVTAGSHTYSSQVGRYTRIGNHVKLYGRVDITTVDGAMAGNLRIGGLPYTIANVSNYNPAGSAGSQNNITFTDQLLFLGINNTTKVNLNEVASGGATTNLTTSDIGATATISFSLEYEV